MFKSLAQSIPRISPRSWFMAGTSVVLAAAALCFSGGAHARSDVSFSVGISAPGVVIGATNAYPVYTTPVYSQPVYGYHPQPVYVQPQPVFVQPRPIYRPRPVYVQAPVYIAPPPVYYRGGHHRHNGHGHGHGGRGHGKGHRR